MGKYVSIRGGASALPEQSVGHFPHDLITVSGVLDLLNNDWKVTEHNPQNMTVDIAVGRGFFRKTAMTYHGYTDAVENPSISANASGNPRIDAVVIYVDLGAVVNADASNVLKFMVVAGTPASSPTAPDNTAVQAAVGAGNPFIRLAEVAVANGASSITNANITDKRANATFRWETFPQWKDYIPTFGGFSVVPTVTARYAVQGKICFLHISTIGAGVSNAPTFTISAPIAAAAGGGHNTYGGILAVDNSGETIATAQLLAGSSTINLYKGSSTNGLWTPTPGNKYAFLTIAYEID